MPHRILLSRRPTNRNRVRRRPLDIHTDDLDAEVARLLASGATLVRSFADHPGKWIVMQDPAGQHFCVVWALSPLRPQADRDDFERRAKEVGEA